MTPLPSFKDSMNHRAPRLSLRSELIARSQFASLLVFTTIAAGANAQDPFDDSSKSPSTQPTATQNANQSSIDSNESSAVVRSLRANPPTTPKEIGQAIGLMTRIRRWDETGRWLDQLAKLDVDGATAVEVLRAAGPRSWAAIESNAREFKPPQLQSIEKLRKLADDEIHSPARLQSQVARLTSPSQPERLAGFDAIRSAGDSGIAAMLDFVMRPNGLNPTISMIEAFSLLGPNAVSAWQAAMTSPHNEVRERLIQLVCDAPMPSMGPELLAALHDPTISESSKESIRKSLAKRGKDAPDAKQTYEYAISVVEKNLDQYQRLEALNDPATRNIWVLGQDGRSVEVQVGNPADQSIGRSSQAAILALRTEPSVDLVSARALAAYLENQAREGVSDLSKSIMFQSLLPESIRDSHEFACLIWDAASKERLPSAQSLAVANLARWQGALMPTSVRERLSAATKSGHPSVRYPAAIALMNSLIEQRNLIPVSKVDADAAQTAQDPQASTSNSPAKVSVSAASNRVSSPESAELGFPDGGFQGASRVDLVAREMQQLMADPVVMIIGASPSLRSHTHDLVNLMGLRYWEASSVEDVFSALRGAVPIEAIFIVDHLRDLDLGQLIQRVRSNPSTSTVPIALLAENLSKGEHMVAGADHGVVVGSVPPTVEGLGDILSRMNQVIAPPRATPEDRIVWKNNAVNYLKIAFPDLGTLDGPGVSIRLADSQEEQNNLLRMAADASQTPKAREQASQIFVQSIRRFGLLISTDTLNAQYHVYNNRGETEPVTRLVMGQILDAIDELYRRNASDPKP